MLTQALQDAIEDNLQHIYAETPLNDIIYQLHACKVLSEGEVDTLGEYRSKQKQNYEFIKILRTREDRDYEKFCDALINHDTIAVKNLGKTLKSRMPTTTNPGQTTEHNNQDEGDFGKVLFIVIDKIGTDWSRLATFLDTQINISVIRSQYPFNVFEQAKEALNLWSQKHPNDATTANLKRGLAEIDRNDIIVAIESSHK